MERFPTNVIKEADERANSHASNMERVDSINADDRGRVASVEENNLNSRLAGEPEDVFSKGVGVHEKDRFASTGSMVDLEASTQFEKVNNHDGLKDSLINQFD